MEPQLVEYQVRIRDMPAQERPRERLRDFGASTLTNAELLAIILRVGVARENAVHVGERLLASLGGLPGIQRASFAELCEQRGLGEAKAAQLKAALELGKRLLAAAPEDRVTIRSPQDVDNLLRGDLALLEQEHLRVVLLNTRNQVVRVQELYVGSVNTAQVRVSEVLRPAVQNNAPALVVVHNHPSGDPQPSAPDVALTRELVSAGTLLDIEVLDHVIIAQGGYVSMKERGLGFPAAGAVTRAEDRSGGA